MIIKNGISVADYQVLHKAVGWKILSDSIVKKSLKNSHIVLSAYEDMVDELSNDLLNDGSMMFKVKGKNKSFLFCADVGISMSDYLLEKWHIQFDGCNFG